MRTEALDNASRIIAPERESETPTQLVGMDKIDMDPGNVREILLDMSDLERIDESSPLAWRQRAQLEEIRGLAKSIEAHGLINPIEVYRMGERFVIATGQRRFLAHRLLGAKMIRASVLMQRPARLRSQQYVENELRSDMTLAESIFGLSAVLSEVGLEAASSTDKVEHLKNGLGLTSATAYRRISVLDGPPALHAAIRDGLITTHKAAYEISMLDAEKVEAAISAHVAGASIDQMGESASPTGGEGGGDQNVVPVKRSGGRPLNSVRLGAVAKPAVVQHIFRAIVSDPSIRASVGTVDVPDIDWTDMKRVSQVWSDLIKKIEAAV